MSQSFDSKPPQAYLRLCEIFSYQDRDPTALRPRGELARVLAASRPGGVFLCLGGGAGEMGAWVLGGMDLSSRLVVVVQDGDEDDKLRPVFGDDLRITVHVQDAVAFLGDVRDHRFDLITDLSPGPGRRAFPSGPGPPGAQRLLPEPALACPADANALGAGYGCREPRICPGSGPIRPHAPGR